MSESRNHQIHVARTDAGGFEFSDPTDVPSNIVAHDPNVATIEIQHGKQRMSLGGGTLSARDVAEIELNQLVARAEEADAHAASLLRPDGTVPPNSADAYKARRLNADNYRRAAAGQAEMANMRLAESGDENSQGAILASLKRQVAEAEARGSRGSELGDIKSLLEKLLADQS